jgi:hypothetical protein
MREEMSMRMLFSILLVSLFTVGCGLVVVDDPPGPDSFGGQIADPAPDPDGPVGPRDPGDFGDSERHRALQDGTACLCDEREISGAMFTCDYDIVSRDTRLKLESLTRTVSGDDARSALKKHWRWCDEKNSVKSNDFHDCGKCRPAA